MLLGELHFIQNLPRRRKHKEAVSRPRVKGIEYLGSYSGVSPELYRQVLTARPMYFLWTEFFNAKPVTAAEVMSQSRVQLVEEGKLDLDQPVTQFGGGRILLLKLLQGYSQHI